MILDRKQLSKASKGSNKRSSREKVRILVDRDRSRDSHRELPGKISSSSSRRKSFGATPSSFRPSFQVVQGSLAVSPIPHSLLA